MTIDATIDNQILILEMKIHWIDEWTMCDHVLAVEELVGLHIGNNMTNILFKVLMTFTSGQGK